MTLHKEYGYSIKYILNELPMLDGWLLYSYAISENLMNRFGGLTMVESPTSIEAEKLTQELIEYNKI